MLNAYMARTSAIIRECSGISCFLAGEPVTNLGTSCMGTVAYIEPNPVVRGVLHVGLTEPVRIPGALGAAGKIIAMLRTMVDVVQSKDVRVGDTVYFGLDADTRPCVASVDLTRRSPGALSYVCPPECLLPTAINDTF